MEHHIRDLKRFSELIDTLVGQGFGYLIRRLHLQVGALKKRKTNPAVGLRIALEKLGPTFIKFGQILSLRPDLIPKEYVKELGKLQDQVPPFPYEDVEKIIKSELKKSISDIFRSFTKKPIASASISQVHAAVLPDGTKVAVKVQRPHMTEIIDSDIKIMMYIAHLLEAHIPRIAAYRPTRIIQEFKEWSHKELDFRIEAKNAGRFRHNFKGSETVIIPKIFPGLSTSKILTMELIEGVELHHLHKIRNKRGYNIQKVIKNGFDSLMTQVFEHGFFHADLHPGNILVLKNNQIGLIDFGIVGHFNKHLKDKSVEILFGIVEEDIDSIVDAFLDMGLVTEGQSEIEEFRRDVNSLIEPLQKATIAQLKISHVLEEVLDLALKHKVQMPVDFVLFGKAIVEVEGIALQYAPRFKVVENTKPFLERLIKKRLSWQFMSKDFMKSLIRFRKFIGNLPEETTKTLRSIQAGRVKVDIEDSDIKRLGIEIDRSSNRLTYGIVIAALIVAGALTINVAMPGLWGIPWVSLLAFIIAGILGIVLIVSIAKEKEVEQ
ncbi:MAG TPA: AarF/ABC1/UbiB kinase family protein [Candidatus Nanoarchaeia archaeon]|nr:AarF/ABC1/UbiB kinase family protein [Candidatus Nanoarchaeia archaeon]